MNGYVVVATKGRRAELVELMERLSRQTVPPEAVVVVGVTEQDVERSPRSHWPPMHVLLSPRAALTTQRNLGIAHLVGPRGLAGDDDFFVVFFDDDFRPAPDWLERCRDAFASNPRVVAVTGRVLADGAQGASLSEEQAEQYLRGSRPPEPHWAGRAAARETDCVYGCNMAFRSAALRRCRFDENLPLYGWQEDQDFTSQARRHGIAMYTPACKGVHLGARSGRISGVRFGYSQVANPVYLMWKGTMDLRKGTWFLLKAALANGLKSAAGSPRADYPGRLRGNIAAVADLVRRRCHPMRVLDLA